MSDDGNELTPIDPFENGGRGADGKFAPGNPGGPGNPRSRQARQVRERLDEALFKVCSPDRLVSAVDAVLKLAETGDVSALKLLMDRIAGPPVDRSVVERIEELEAAMSEGRRGGPVGPVWNRK